MVTAKRTAGQIGSLILVLSLVKAGSSIRSRNVYVASSIRTILQKSFVSSSYKEIITYLSVSPADCQLPTQHFFSYQRANIGEGGGASYFPRKKLIQIITNRLQLLHQPERRVAVITSTYPRTHPLAMYPFVLFISLSKYQFVGDYKRR